MKKKNGFTLVELIAVIVILGIVLTITAVTITNVREKTLENQYKNLQTTIKTAAQGYHEDTGIMKVPVLILLQKGVVEADEIAKREMGYELSTDNYKYTVAIGDPVLYDPRDKSLALNCDYIDFDGHEKGKYVSANTNDDNNGCDANILGENSVEVQVWYKLKNQKTEDVVLQNYNENKWYSLADGQTLKYKPNSEGKLDSYFWTSEIAPDELLNEGADLEVIAPPSGLVDAEYTLTTTIDGSEFSNSFRVRADARKPYVEDAYIKDAERWGLEKDAYVHIFDNESGLKKFYISKNANCSESTGNLVTNSKREYTGTSVKEDEITTTLTSSGSYYFCVKDQADNTQEEIKKVVINKIDRTGPSVTGYVKDAGKWGKSKEVTVVVIDNGDTSDKNSVSGIASGQKIHYAWGSGTNSLSGDVTLSYLDCDNTTLKNGNGFLKTTCDNIVKNVDGIYPAVYGTFTLSEKTGEKNIVFSNSSTPLIDNAGNDIENFGGNLVAKLDNTPPTCASGFTGQTTWTNSASRTTNIECYDPHSGCKESANYSKTTTVDINKVQKTDSLVIYDSVGNKGVCEYDVLIDRKAPTCSSSGGSPDWTKDNVTLIGTCSDSDSGCVSNASKLYNSDINVTNQTPGSVLDNAGNSVDCPDNQTVKIDKTAPVITNVSNPSGGYTVYEPFAVTMTYVETGSGVSTTGYYKYDRNGGYLTETWTVNTSKNTVTTADFSAERNQTVYFKVCDKVGNCTDPAADTNIHIDYCYDATATTDTSKCSVECGGGKYWVDYTSKSSYANYKSCGGGWDGAACKTQSCCDADCQRDAKVREVCESISSSTLYGTYKDSMAGNTDNVWVDSTESWGDWCHNGVVCHAPGGYYILCASSQCGVLQGARVKDIKKRYKELTGSDCGLSNYWCSCTYGANW